MSAFDEARTYRLGGGTTGQGVFSRDRLRSLIPIVVVFVIVLILVASTQSLIVLGIGTVVLAVMVWLAGRRTEAGASWLGTWSQRQRFTLARHFGWDGYNPDVEALPVTMGNARFRGVAPADGEALLSVVEHRDQEVFTSVVEIEGGGEGIREVFEHNLDTMRLGNFLAAVADVSLPVSQIDVVTRAQPATGDLHGAWLRDHLVPGLPPRLQDSMAELPEMVEGRAETFSSWMVISMPTSALSARIAEEFAVSATTEALTEMAYAVTEQVASLARDAGMTIRHGMPPRRLGALIRSMLIPSRDAHDLSGIDRTVDGFVAFEPDQRGMATVATDPDADVDWHHAVGTIPISGWPEGEVYGRWLSPLVMECNASHRLVAAQFALVPRLEAAERARAAATFDRARVLKEHKQGVVSGGEAQARETSSFSVLADIVRGGACGIRPVVRVMVSAPSSYGLQSARKQVEAIVRGPMQLMDWEWHDYRQTHGLITCLPFGRGVHR